MLRKLAVLGFALLPLMAPAAIGSDLPPPSANLETIPAGSLVIPMDNTKQALVAPFNLKAYGLVNDLLWNAIPVKWVIASGKAKDGADFTATAARLYPSAQAAASLSFSGGPFVVHRDFVPFAQTRIAAFGNNVAVYQLTQDVTVDVRYTLTQRRKVGVLDDGGNEDIHRVILEEAGFTSGTHFTVISATTLVTINANVCITSASEPHCSTGKCADPQVQAIRDFVQGGGNFLGQCEAIVAYENNATHGRFQTTNGVVTSNVNSTSLDYLNPDLAYSQFVGALEDAGGSIEDYSLAAASSFRNGGHIHVRNSGANSARMIATLSKLVGGNGGLVLYLGGHEYKNNTIESKNGRRMYLNHVMMPSGRPVSCGFDFAVYTIAGSVYEDVNGDGALGDAVGRGGVRMRLYRDANDNGLVDVGDTLVAEGSTAADGSWSFQVTAGAGGTKYLVAADSKTVTPSAGFNAGASQANVWAEQTRGDDPSSAALDVGPRFGGRTPGTSDAVSASDTTPAANQYQHLARVPVSGANVSGVDFAFSFQVVTNTRAGDAADDDASAARTVQGSLRQFLQNANAISGANALRFVPATATNASGDGGSWWRIGVTSALPALTDASTTIDGRAYASTDGSTVRDDNPGTLGAGGTVGTDSLALGAVARPELEIQNLRSTAVVNLGLDVQGASAVVRRIALFGFGAAADSDGSANLRLGASASSALIEAVVLGTAASSFTDPGAAARSGGDNLRSLGADSVTLQDSLVGFAAGSGVQAGAGSNGWTVQRSEIRGNAIGNPALQGLGLEGGSSGATVSGNRIADHEGPGVSTVGGGGSHTISNNTITGNGVGSGGGVETPGLHLGDSGSTISKNVIQANYGAGVLVRASASAQTISQNSISANGTIANKLGGAASGQVGIDLLAAGDDQARGTSPFVTRNDSGDGDTGGNGLLNFPVLASASVAGGNLTLAGFARPGSVIELFLAAADPSGFGEGQSYLVTLSEGSGADADSGTGSYAPPVNGLDQGSDTTNRFSFTIPTPGGVAVGSVLTATATLAGATSEFSGIVTVQGARGVSGTVYEDLDHDARLAAPEAGTGLTLYVKLVPESTPAGPATQAVAATPATGAYSFASVTAGSWRLVLDDNATLADVTPTLPAGWIGSEPPGLVRANVVVAAADVPEQNFGLFHGSRASGTVFRDDGAAGGTSGDGVQQAGEAGIPNVTLRALHASCAGGVCDEALSGGDGGYRLWIPASVGASTLAIAQTNLPSWLSTGGSAGDSGGSYDRGTDRTSFTNAVGASYTGVHFADVPPNQLTTEGRQTALPGAVVFYPHSFVAGAAGSVSFSTSDVAAPALAGWTATLHHDADCDATLYGGEPPLAATTALLAGETLCLLVKVTIPEGAPFGAQDVLTLGADFAYANAAPALSAQASRSDVTLVGEPQSAGLVLLKSVDKASAQPGETLTYTVTYTNQGSAPLASITIRDATPAYTTHLAAGCGAPLPPAVTGCSVGLEPAPGATGTIEWVLSGELAPGSSGTVQFSVTID